jgi:hypothetical protein
LLDLVEAALHGRVRYGTCFEIESEELRFDGGDGSKLAVFQYFLYLAAH